MLSPGWWKYLKIIKPTLKFAIAINKRNDDQIGVEDIT